MAMGIQQQQQQGGVQILSPASNFTNGCELTKVQREKIALADVVLEADRIIRESLAEEDIVGGFRWVQPIAWLAAGVVEKRLPPGCLEMTRLATVARNLDPLFSNPTSMRFTQQYKIFTWDALHQSGAWAAHKFRRGRQDDTDAATTGIYQLLSTGEMLPSFETLEKFASKRAKLRAAIKPDGTLSALKVDGGAGAELAGGGAPLMSTGGGGAELAEGGGGSPAGKLAGGAEGS